MKSCAQVSGPGQVGSRKYNFLVALTLNSGKSIIYVLKEDESELVQQDVLQNEAIMTSHIFELERYLTKDGIDYTKFRG
jgi:hypothetical protein